MTRLSGTCLCCFYSQGWSSPLGRFVKSHLQTTLWVRNSQSRISRRETKNRESRKLGTENTAGLWGGYEFWKLLIHTVDWNSTYMPRSGHTLSKELRRPRVVSLWLTFRQAGKEVLGRCVNSLRDIQGSPEKWKMFFFFFWDILVQGNHCQTTSRLAS